MAKKNFKKFINLFKKCNQFLKSFFFGKFSLLNIYKYPQNRAATSTTWVEK